MKDKELRKLNRQDLLRLLLEAEKENRRLNEALGEAQARLGERELRLSRAGDLAEAALSLNGVFEAAQRAALQYCESVRALCDRQAEESRRTAAERLDRSRRMLAETESRCREMEAAARALYERAAAGEDAGDWESVHARMDEYLAQHPGLRAGDGV